jgi:uncharacterized lipoprotein YddW (UPF0748 family)
MLRFIAFLIFPFLAVNALHAQSPKYEFRGAWIATVANIDWPSKPALPAEQQQREFITLLDQLKAIGCNAVIVQVRPVCDAFYDSKIEPWSHYLTGVQGQPPVPFYDPLSFMVAETHKRNMEFHAWFNPYRALMDSKKNPNPPTHVTRAHPTWIIAYDGKSYLDPGLPEVREYVTRVITDVVKRYDIDAVHMDDYFYPYRSPGKEFGDAKTFAMYGNGLGIDDWRRQNVNLFINMLNTSIKHEKSFMKLGISPFGVWRNKSKDPRGSETKGGQTNYDDLYADVLLWMQKGWIDYLMPQLYWEHTHKAVAFEILMPWWYDHCFQRHMYYGLGLYRMTDAKKGPWTNVHELMWQLRDIRGKCPNSGYSFYSATSFDKIKAPVRDSIRLNYNQYPALVPPMAWLDSIPPAPPVLKSETTPKGLVLRWQVSNPKKEPLRYVVYRFVNNEAVNLDRNDKILSVQQGNEFTDPDAGKYRQHTYVVTALDRTWNESKPSNIIK